jgi:hypothetical protein
MEERGGIEVAQMSAHVRQFEQARSRGNQQADAKLNGRDIFYQILIGEHREQVAVAVERRPGSERHESRLQYESQLAETRRHGKKIGAGVPFGKAIENGVVDRFNGSGDKKASGIAQGGEMFGMMEQMLDFYRDIVAHVGKFAMQLADNGERVRAAVEKVGIAKGDVLGSRANLPADVFEHNLSWDDAKNTVVDGHNRAVTAEMLAAAAGLGVTRDEMAAAGQHHVRVFVQRRKASAVGHDEMKTIERYDGRGGGRCGAFGFCFITCSYKLCEASLEFASQDGVHTTRA